MKPIIIIASERSGTNLLRRILGAHSDVATPPPPHMWKHLGNLLPYYGPLNNEENLIELISDAIKMIDVPDSHLRWKHIFTNKQVLFNLKEKSLSGVVCSLYDLFGQKEGCSHVVFKEIDIYNYIFEIISLYPDAKFIYLVRDGRDVCCSVKLVPSLEHHVYCIAEKWKTEQEGFLRIYQDLISRESIFIYRYEDLLENPSLKINEICNFLGIVFKDTMLSFFENTDAQLEAQKKPDYWRNLAKPIMKNNKGKFLRELPPDEIKMFESIAGSTLQLLGYSLETEGDCVYTPEEIQRFRRENKKIKAEKQKEALTESGNKNRADLLEQLRVKRKELKLKSFFQKQIIYT